MLSRRISLATFAIASGKHSFYTLPNSSCKFRVRLNEEVAPQNESSLISKFSVFASDLVFDQFASFNMQVIAIYFHQTD